MDRLGIEDVQILHGSAGFPDWIVLTNDLQLQGYEIKPVGTGKDSRLNGLQYKAAVILLSSSAWELFLVRYVGSGSDIRYVEEIELTLDNLDDYS
jgi:hypothetical protein